MSPILLLIQVSRPIVWPILPIVYYLGLDAAHAAITPAAIAQMVLLTFPMNLIGCGLNDIYDIESDRHCLRRRAIWGAVVREADRPLVFAGCLAMMPLVVLGACITTNWDNIVATVSLVLVAWFYSVPPVRLKERPPLDALAKGVGYFYLPFVMGYSLNADPRHMPLKYYLLGLCVCGIHALASAADYDADRAANHRTIAVAWGRRGACIAAFLTFLTAWLLGDFESTAVRVYIAACTVITMAAALLPYERVIVAACSAIFGGFLLAALVHITISYGG